MPRPTTYRLRQLHWHQASKELRSQLAALSLGSRGCMAPIARTGVEISGPKAKACWLVVAYDGPTPVGWACAQQLRIDDEYLRVYTYVRHDLRRQGLGTRLIKTIRRRAHTQFPGILRLRVHPHTKAATDFFAPFSVKKGIIPLPPLARA